MRFGVFAAICGLLLPAFANAADESVVVESAPAEETIVMDPALAEVYAAPAADDACMKRLRRSCNCCPEWPDYLVFDALFLQRDNATNGQPIAVGSDVSPDPGATLLTTRSMQFATAPGVRLFYGRRGPNGVGWELGYLGVYGMFADAAIDDPDMITVPGNLGQAVKGWATADVERPTYASSLNIVEANMFLYECGQACDPNAVLACKSCRHCLCTDLIGGFFWAGLDETAALNVTCCEGEPPSPYRTRTSSNLFGAQVGLRRRADWKRWAFEQTYKIGLAGVALSQSADAITSPLAPGLVYREPQSAEEGGVGFLSQINLTAVYRIDRHWGLRLGYNLIWLGGVALGPDQWDFTDTTTSGEGISAGAGLFLQGANLGLERRW